MAFLMGNKLRFCSNLLSSFPFRMRVILDYCEEHECMCRDMIRTIRTCKTAAEERAAVAKECAILRDKLKEPTQHHRHRTIAKLMFIHMLGYPTHFGQMECIKLIAEGDFPEKRIGYLGLMVLLDERQEVLMLVTNSIKKYPLLAAPLFYWSPEDFARAMRSRMFKTCVSKSMIVWNLTQGSDLYHPNQHVTGLALCSFGNICTSIMARELSSEIERLLHDKNAYVRKKVAYIFLKFVDSGSRYCSLYLFHSMTR